ncbi:MAG: hypothetical protein ACPGRC_02655 [Salibacteraceae bacterium]
MMLAGSEGIWLYAIIGIASLIYKAWKKGQEDKKSTSESSAEETSTGTSFGFEDLINQFEQKYGMQKDSVTEPQQINHETKVDYSFQEGRKEKETMTDQDVVDTAIENIPSGLSSAENTTDNSKVRDKNYKGISPQREVDLDLEDLIIAKTILERPYQ